LGYAGERAEFPATTEVSLLTKDQLLASMRHETKIIKHLAEKVTPDLLEWRPTPGQRSIDELLKYLPISAEIPCVNLFTQNWDHAQDMSAKAETVTLETFADAMDAQMNGLDEMIRKVDVASALETDATLPWGAPIKQGQGFIDMPLKALVAYRMQLFLYLKQAGIEGLTSANCWVGVDAPPPPAEPPPAEPPSAANA
jgi:hypothetical protein